MTSWVDRLADRLAVDGGRQSRAARAAVAATALAVAPVLYATRPVTARAFGP